MPIKKEDKKRYPKNWKEISIAIREKAKNRCQGSPSYPDCRAENKKPHPITGSIVVLTVAHLDHTPENCDESNLRAMCQRCHLNYDKDYHRKSRENRKRVIQYKVRYFYYNSNSMGSELFFDDYDDVLSILDKFKKLNHITKVSVIKYIDGVVFNEDK